MTRFHTILIASAGALALSACASKEPKELPPEPLPPVTDTGMPDYGDDTAGVAQLGTQEHFVAGVSGQNVIYFDTDRYNIDSADAAALQTQARYLGMYPSITVTVEGHADERGTRDYNLALGERRANAAKNYLVGLGISAARIRTVSYGKERPVALGSNEAAWAQNRRAVTVVVN
ncbi:peptidoglycan-associated lipoprotein Pal [Alteriqipengyuania sp. WL0013]|uniref:peptidoglycan-associated lipoprotein Pal n=1 Tax=Alteriqipengyuania sp. WL0013 TaxID=3110773 RepID=UPI002CD976F0|nr:peptidoglycan-associated lipoprotein Pal [Alteriqipengyuania sp. WL0013]MEB3416901.1 peptidoglycan-associated lipoprotein Pal [Alteriqipengyuania sp. WL0013]